MASYVAPRHGLLDRIFHCGSPMSGLYTGSQPWKLPRLLTATPVQLGAIRGARMLTRYIHAIVEMNKNWGGS